MKPTLVIMAAGMGSRFGGLKQIEPVGPFGEIIIDYSIFDAIKSGFGKVVFIINRNIEQDFKEAIGSRIEKEVETVYVYQNECVLPNGFISPKERTKPWGTAIAVYACKDVVNTPFCIISADDFYGRNAFEVTSNYLKNVDVNSFNYSMVGFYLKNTLSENGYVSRGVCNVDDDGNLLKVTEHTHIVKEGNNAKFSLDNGESYNDISMDTIVSMITWGVTPSIFGQIERLFGDFITENKDNLEKAEFYLPFVIDTLIQEKLANVKVLPCAEKWHGVTYAEDKLEVQNEILNMCEKGVYPMNLWDIKK